MNRKRISVLDILNIIGEAFKRIRNKITAAFKKEKKYIRYR